MTERTMQFIDEMDTHRDLYEVEIIRKEPKYCISISRPDLKYRYDYYAIGDAIETKDWYFNYFKQALTNELERFYGKAIA